jgi:hypothetical protein
MYYYKSSLNIYANHCITATYRQKPKALYFADNQLIREFMAKI